MRFWYLIESRLMESKAQMRFYEIGAWVTDGKSIEVRYVPEETDRLIEARAQIAKTTDTPQELFAYLLERPGGYDLSFSTGQAIDFDGTIKEAADHIYRLMAATDKNVPGG